MQVASYRKLIKCLKIQKVQTVTNYETVGLLVLSPHIFRVSLTERYPFCKKINILGLLSGVLIAVCFC